MYDSLMEGNGHSTLQGAERELRESSDTIEGEHAVPLKDLFGTIWKRLWVVLLVAGVLTGAAVGFSLAQTPMYESSIEILVGQKENAPESYNLQGDVLGLQQITQTMVRAVGSRPVAETVIERQGLQITTQEFLENRLSVEPVAETQFIEVRYKDPDPRRAQRTADAVGEVFSEQVSKVSPSANAVTATVWEPAALPGEPVSPNPVRNGLLALALGLMLGVVLAFLLEFLDDRWHSPEEMERVSGVPTFGLIPEFKAYKAEK